MYQRQFHADVVTTNGDVSMIPDQYGQAQDRVEFAEATSAMIGASFSDSGTVNVYGYKTGEAGETGELLVTLTEADTDAKYITDTYRYLTFETADLTTDYTVHIVALITYG